MEEGRKKNLASLGLTGVILLPVLSSFFLAGYLFFGKGAYDLIKTDSEYSFLAVPVIFIAFAFTAVFFFAGISFSVTGIIASSLFLSKKRKKYKPVCILTIVYESLLVICFISAVIVFFVFI